MPKLTIPAKQLEPPTKLPDGIYEVILNGFKPSLTSGKSGKEKSVNLNPQMKVINHPDAEINGKQVRDFLNQNAGWIINDFSHAFGFELVDKGNGGLDLVGTFEGPDSDPTKWTYVGDSFGNLMGQTGKLEVATVPDRNDASKTYTNIKRYFCQVPNCQHKHAESLL